MTGPIIGLRRGFWRQDSRLLVQNDTLIGKTGVNLQSSIADSIILSLMKLLLFLAIIIRVIYSLSLRGRIVVRNFWSFLVLALVEWLNFAICLASTAFYK